ncbi:hypothetical protein ADL15_05100 [Actinoplanes awajinensis subsp. mycoplanecinus]|uniref:Uncharacterized protein n=1 Tax=Actinoplanes awajinensis subsp. mycoplanecinus TaxID=135947 RepID=A0A0X3V973_9ACTN|nr:hypothetical protein ADL15_05100 [Actinoplanes awajinensis subsp. mycoplanecinus]
MYLPLSLTGFRRKSAPDRRLITRLAIPQWRLDMSMKREHRIAGDRSDIVSVRLISSSGGGHMSPAARLFTFGESARPELPS